MNEQQEREAFEAYCTRKHDFKKVWSREVAAEVYERSPDGGYANFTMHACWMAWQTGQARAALAANVPADLPKNETPQMHNAAMAVLYAGVTRGNTNALWRAYRQALLAAAPAPEADLSHSVLAESILGHLGFACAPSMEPGADARRDVLAEKLAGWLAAPAPEAEQVAWVWNPASVAWERVRVYGHWTQGALYAFGPLPPDPLVEPAQAQQSAVATLERLGYECKGGELWRPPLGHAPPCAKPEVQQPLTDDQLDLLAFDAGGLPNSHIEFARAIERAHGIGASGEASNA